MYCRELFEHCAALLIPHGVLRGSSPVPLHPAPETSTQSVTFSSASSHLYHSKHFINRFVSQTSARLHPQALSFDRHPFFAGGGVGYQTGYPPAATPALCPPVSPLATSLTNDSSRNPLYLPLLRKKVGVGGPFNTGRCHPRFPQFLVLVLTFLPSTFHLRVAS